MEPFRALNVLHQALAPPGRRHAPSRSPPAAERPFVEILAQGEPAVRLDPQFVLPGCGAERVRAPLDSPGDAGKLAGDTTVLAPASPAPGEGLRLCRRVFRGTVAISLRRIRRHPAPFHIWKTLFVPFVDAGPI